jgi:hypothetical protein
MTRTDSKFPDPNLRCSSPRSFTRSSLPSRGARLSGHAGRTGRSCTTRLRWRSGTGRKKRAEYPAPSPRSAPRSSQPDEDLGAAPFRPSLQLHRVVAGVEDEQWGTSSRSGNWLSSPFTCQMRAFCRLGYETRLSRYRELQTDTGKCQRCDVQTVREDQPCGFVLQFWLSEHQSIDLLRALHIQPC